MRHGPPPELEEHIREQKRLREYFQMRRDKKKRGRRIEIDPEQTFFEEDGRWRQ